MLIGKIKSVPLLVIDFGISHKCLERKHKHQSLAARLDSIAGFILDYRVQIFKQITSLIRIRRILMMLKIFLILQKCKNENNSC